MVGITFSIYRERDDGTPLWTGTQNVTIDEQGRFTVLLGDTEKDGIPLDLFRSGEARWLGMQRIPERESERIMLTSVPYALKAADAETLGGKPLSAFVLTEESDDPAKKRLKPVVNGTAGYIAKFVDSTNINDSILYESAGKIGLSNVSPQAPLHIGSIVTYRGVNVGSAQTGPAPGILFENPVTNSSLLLSENFGLVIFESSSSTAPFTNSDFKLVLRPSGFLGLGTESPQAPLHIGRVANYRNLSVASVQSGFYPGIMLENTLTNSTIGMTENGGLSIFTKASSTTPFDSSDLRMVLTTAAMSASEHPHRQANWMLPGL
jgi:hypothetical protein